MAGSASTAVVLSRVSEFCSTAVVVAAVEQTEDYRAQT